MYAKPDMGPTVILPSFLIRLISNSVPGRPIRNEASVGEAAAAAAAGAEAAAPEAAEGPAEDPAYRDH